MDPRLASGLRIRNRTALFSLNVRNRTALVSLNVRNRTALFIQGN